MRITKRLDWVGADSEAAAQYAKEHRLSPYVISARVYKRTVRAAGCSSPVWAVVVVIDDDKLDAALRALRIDPRV